MTGAGHAAVAEDAAQAAGLVVGMVFDGHNQVAINGWSDDLATPTSSGLSVRTPVIDLLVVPGDLLVRRADGGLDVFEPAGRRYRPVRCGCGDVLNAEDHGGASAGLRGRAVRRLRQG